MAYSTEELVQAATWAVSYDNDKEYACRFRREFNKKPPDQKTITAWKKDLLETGGPPTETPHGVRFLPYVMVSVCCDSTHSVTRS